MRYAFAAIAILICGILCYIVANRVAEANQPDADQLYQQAMVAIRELETLSRTRSLTRDDVHPTWGIIMKFHQAGGERTYERLIQLYEHMHKLKLPAVDFLETIRLLGQHQYLSDNNEASVAMFSRADEISRNELSGTDREICMDKLSHILYLKGLALTDSEDGEKAAIENFERLLHDGELIQCVEPSTAVNIYQRQGRLQLAGKDFGKAAETFRTGTELLDKLDASNAKTEKQYRIEMEVERSHAAALAENAEAPNLEKVLEELDALDEKYREREEYDDFYLLLRRRVSIAREVGPEQYRDALEKQRSWYVERHSVTGAWERSDRDTFLSVSESLVEHLLEQKDEEKAEEVLVETMELAEPPQDWLLRFPKSIVQEAFEKSVPGDDR